ncbi:MAG: class I SAM-dependent methyltransferase [Anaerolineae bacterium]
MTESLQRCQCEGIEQEFDEKGAAKALKRYRQKGPDKTTRMLLDALVAEGVEGMTLLDIGGGVGAIPNRLLRAGVATAAGVDASTAHVKAAGEEAQRQGHADRVSFHHGNFVEMAAQIPPADIVTLDRVICCYHDVEGLVGGAAEKADRFLGAVYPRDTWWARAFERVGNAYQWARRRSFRGFVHRTHVVDGLLRKNGLIPRSHGQTILWQVVVYARPSAGSEAAML